MKSLHTLFSLKTLCRTPVRAPALILLSLLLYGCQSDEEKAASYLESAQEYYEKGEYSLATVELKNAIKRDSTLADAYYLQAKIFELHENWEAMFAFLSSALQQNPEHLNANLEIAKLYATAGNSTQAKSHMEAASAAGAEPSQLAMIESRMLVAEQKYADASALINSIIDESPKNTEAYLLLANVQLSQKKFAAAIATLDKTSFDPSVSEEALLLKAKAYSLQANFSAAAGQARQLTEQFPKELNHHFLLSALLIKIGDINGAEQALRNAVAVKPDDPKPKIALAGFINERENTEKAIETLTSFISGGAAAGQNEIKLILAELYQQQSDYEQARAIYNRLLNDTGSVSSTAKNKLALLALKENDSDKALEILNEVLLDEFNNLEALISRALVYISKENTDNAITDLLNALREDPNSELALLLISQAYKQIDDDKQAAVYLKRLTTLNPSHHQAVAQYSRYLQAENNFPESIVILEAHLSQTKSTPEIERLLINAYLATENWGGAIKLAELIATRTQQPEYVDFVKANIYRLKRQHDKSIEAFDQLVASNLFVGPSLKNIVESNRALGTPKQSIRYLQNYVASHPDDLYANFLLAKEFRLQGQYQEATTVLLNTLANNDSWGQGNFELAKIYAIQKNWDSAIRYGEKALPQNQSSNIQLLLVLASAHEQQGNYPQAIRYYSTVLDLAPKMDAVANNLAILLAKDPANLEQAFTIAARFENSNQPLFLDTLGWIYYLRGDLQQAAALLERAVFSASKEAVIHYHLGTTLFDLKEFDKARLHLESALELSKTDNNFAYAQELDQLIGALPTPE